MSEGGGSATTAPSSLLLNGSGFDLTGQSTEFIQIVPDAFVLSNDSQVSSCKSLKQCRRACLELGAEPLRHTRFHVLHALAVSSSPCLRREASFWQGAGKFNLTHFPSQPKQLMGVKVAHAQGIVSWIFDVSAMGKSSEGGGKTEAPKLPKTALPGAFAAMAGRRARQKRVKTLAPRLFPLGEVEERECAAVLTHSEYRGLVRGALQVWGYGGASIPVADGSTADGRERSWSLKGTDEDESRDYDNDGTCSDTATSATAAEKRRAKSEVAGLEQSLDDFYIASKVRMGRMVSLIFDFDVIDKAYLSSLTANSAPCHSSFGNDGNGQVDPDITPRFPPRS